MKISKVIEFIITFVILFISITMLNYVYAKNNEIIEEWEAIITSDAKEINDTQEINFKVEENENVVPNKIAPGMKATAEIEINLEKVKGLVDIELKINDLELNKAFELNAKLDEKTISNQKIEKIEPGSIKKIRLELIWNENNIEDTKIGINVEKLEVPIQVKVLQHI